MKKDKIDPFESGLCTTLRGVEATCNRLYEITIKARKRVERQPKTEKNKDLKKRLLRYQKSLGQLAALAQEVRLSIGPPPKQ